MSSGQGQRTASPTRRWARRARIAAGVAAVAMAAVVGVRSIAVSDTGDTKPEAELQEGTAVADAPPPPGEEPTKVLATYSVPAAVAPPPSVSCPPTWSYFDNPALHYGLCYPPGWGFSEFRRPLPETSIRSQTLESLHLLSGEAFPWTVGDHSFTAIETRKVMEVELDVLEAEAEAEGECELTPRNVNGRELSVCEQYLDATGLPAPTGPIHVLKVVIPLAQPPAPSTGVPIAPGARLLVVVRAPSEQPLKESDLRWHIIATITPY